jgi:hypothetical protein
MSAHPLSRFIYETFDQQFGELLMVGYGAEPGAGRRRLHLIESQDGVETGWVIALVTRRPPCHDEPLVMAALLKLLLSRPSVSQHLEFELGELLAELRWPDSLGTRRRVETAIGVYVRLLYDKQVDVGFGPCTTEAAGGGYYHLLTGYVKGAKSDEERARSFSGVYFDTGFIKGIERRQVFFAGINFGRLQTAGEVIPDSSDDSAEP